MTDTLAADPRDSLTRNEVLMMWQTSKDALARCKEQEMEWRKYVVKRAFPNAAEGTNTVELGAGYKLKANVKYNYGLESNSIVENTLDEIAKIGNEGKLIADRLVSVTYNFLKTEYNILQEQAESGNPSAIEILKLVHKMLIITDAAPIVNIVEPKAVRK